MTLTKAASPLLGASPDTRDDLDALRAVAVLSVIFFHLHIAGFRGGYVGVDMFFVISGFLITNIIVKQVRAGSFSLLHFFERRVRRLIPSLYVMLAFSSIAAIALLPHTDLRPFAHSLMSSLLMAANIFFLFSNNYFDGSADNKPLLHLWTLGVETQFYLIWPIILLLALRFLQARAIVAAVMLGALSLAGAVVLGKSNPDAGFYLLPARLFEFLIGAGLVWFPAITNASLQKKFADMFVVAGLIMLGLAVTLYTNETVFPSFHALLPCIGTVLVIYAVPHSRLRSLFANPAMAYVGRISYELYLFHWPVIVFYKYYMPASIAIYDSIIMLAVAGILSVLTYHLVGYPLRYGFAKDERQKKLFLLGCLAVCSLMIGGAFAIKNGPMWSLQQLQHKFQGSHAEGEMSDTLLPEVYLFAKDPSKFHETRFGGAGYKENTLIVIGDTSAAPEFLLLGDSFASQYAAALSGVLHEYHKSAYLYFVNACMFTSTRTIHMYAKQRPECDNAYETIRPLLNDSRLPVIQAQSWSSYKYDIDLGGSVQTFTKENNDDYYAFIMGIIDQMRIALQGRQYVFVGIAPGFGYQEKLIKCFTNTDYLLRECKRTVAMPEKESANGQEFNLAALAYAAAHKEVGFINPRVALCNNGFCYAINSKQILYSDAAHLSKAGALQVIGAYKDLLLSLHPDVDSATAQTQKPVQP